MTQTDETSRIAEIVTFRSFVGIPEAEVIRAAGALGAFLQSAQGFVARQLSLGPDGSWTDHVIWRDMASAMTAAEGLMQDASAAPFMAMIDPASIRMTHAQLVVSQQAA